MFVQLSAGQGPAECELAVAKLYDALKQEFPDIKLVSSHAAKQRNCYTSMLFTTEEDLSQLEGTVQWICQSPFRPHHKRKNWFVDVSVIPEKEEICRDQKVKFERFHSGGNGGQNVNKVETGVRLVHIPTGITVTSTAERSQLQNRKDAQRKLKAILDQKEQQAQDRQEHDAWREHMRLVRGNPVRVYEGMQFRRRK